MKKSHVHVLGNLACKNMKESWYDMKRWWVLYMKKRKEIWRSSMTKTSKHAGMQGIVNKPLKAVWLDCKAATFIEKANT